MHALISMVGLGFDSFLACLAIGFYAASWRERFRLAVAFGACDAAATLLGSVWPHPFPEPLALATYFLCVFLLAMAAQSRRELLHALPVLLSVDNLFGGLSANTAPALGAGSALMALLGLSLAALGRRVFSTLEAEV